MKVVWTPEALQDRIDIWDHISADNPHAAVRMDGLFSDCANRLSEHPNMGRSGRVQGTRELVAHEHYALVYEIYNETIWVLTLLHTARLWPPAKP